jgi:hypothetical protein
MENFDFNNIEKYLRDGGNPETIAKAFADKLNITIHTIDDEKSLNNASEKVSVAWNDYVNAYFGTHKLPNNTILEDWYVTTDDIKALMDSLIKIIPTIDKYLKTIENFNDIISPVKVKVTNTTIKTKNKVDNVVDDFFSKYGI